MASRVKEDERNERIIRGLLKLPENRRCVNCNSLGPQYVCTNFWTFVCTTCSGIHREFTHRVKSVSLAKFTSQEVAALQEGGNKRARDIYLKEWDPQRQSAPDGSNVDRLRDFIKHVYVDRRYSGDRNSGKSLSAKFSDKEDSYHGGSRSPPYEDTYERRYSEMSSPGGRSDDRTRYGYDERRSPGYDQESRQYNDYKRSPARPEVVNDWRREDRFGNGKKADDRRASDGETKLESRSPEHVKDPEASSPVVRPVREILGDNVVPLRISEPPRANLRSPDGPAQTQRTASSSSLGSASGNATEVKMENTVSLIDFDADPEPPVIATAPQTQQARVSQTAAQPASTTSDNNWASFDFAPEVTVSEASTNANPLESVLTQLSGHQPGVPSGSGAPVAANAANITVSGATTGNPPLSTFNTGASPVTLVNSFSTFPSAGVSAAAPALAPSMPVNGGNSFIKISEAGHWPNVQHQQPSLFSASSGKSTTQQFPLSSNIASVNQPWNMSLASNAQTASSTPVGAAQLISSAAPGVAGSGALQPSVAEVKSSGRQELPADLFTSTYSPFPAQFHGWQTVPPRGMGFPMQYIGAAVPMPTSVHPSKSMNPFDLNEPLPVQAQTFPSMASLQGALPNMQISSGLQRTSSLGAPPPPSAWMPSQSLPYPSALPGQSLPNASPILRPYMAQQVPNTMPFSGHQGFGREGSSFGGVNMDQQLAGKFSAPSPFSSVGGNPFG